jgi:hypothetical protein
MPPWHDPERTGVFPSRDNCCYAGRVIAPVVILFMLVLLVSSETDE